jgi:TetR/AcrR family tetracycline transcriptional repressor
MAKLTRDNVIDEALRLLDEVGLDGLSTRQLAKRLGIEQPSLYWHFRKKEDLLAAMAEAAMLPHATAPLPSASDDWRDWFLENNRSFRRTLLLHRDGARLHAGLIPGGADIERIKQKLAFLVASGLHRQDAMMAMLTASRFTVGSVLEEQAESQASDGEVLPIDPEVAFEEGLLLIVDGMASRMRYRE